MNTPGPSVAVVSPFVDKRHGTERCLAEQLERLAGDYEIHLFSSRVEDLDLSGIVWHPVPGIPGPEIVKFLWWFAANPIARWRESRKSGRAFDLVYSPGANCLDADVIVVHHLFASQLERVSAELRWRCHRLRAWPALAHRRLYYGLLARLERRIYSRPQAALAAVSRAMAAELAQRFHRGDRIAVLYNGVDRAVFNPLVRGQRRECERRKLGFAREEVVALLIGNDWAKKGLPCLIEALAELPGLPVRALVLGRDARQPYLDRAKRLGVADRVVFADSNRDVMRFFAAADLYAAPSVYDPFGLPVLEAMSCGLPVVASRAMGAAELLSDGVDGLLLDDPRDATSLAGRIRQLATDGTLRERLGRNAAETAGKFTWDANAEAVKRLFGCALERKRRTARGGVPQA
ncbi:MAG TPA: glycosyltransferase family 4 protein [Candidatus Acidoferrales bacterium]|nr:glycosyltransferase family 4 protein [Candidatus Acidoferrales bacterium]